MFFNLIQSNCTPTLPNILTSWPSLITKSLDSLKSVECNSRDFLALVLPKSKMINLLAISFLFIFFAEESWLYNWGWMILADWLLKFSHEPCYTCELKIGNSAIFLRFLYKNKFLLPTNHGRLVAIASVVILISLPNVGTMQLRFPRSLKTKTKQNKKKWDLLFCPKQKRKRIPMIGREITTLPGYPFIFSHGDCNSAASISEKLYDKFHHLSGLISEANEELPILFKCVLV